MSGICVAVNATTSNWARSRNRTLKLWKSRPAAPAMTTRLPVIWPEDRRAAGGARRAQRARLRSPSRVLDGDRVTVRDHGLDLDLPVRKPFRPHRVELLHSLGADQPRSRADDDDLAVVGDECCVPVEVPLVPGLVELPCDCRVVHPR